MRDDTEQDQLTSLVAQSTEQLNVRSSIVRRGLQELSEHLHGNAVQAARDQSLELFKQGHIEEAIAICNTGLEMAPTDEILWQIMGVCFAKLGRHDEGLNCIDRALESDPTNPYCWALKCNLLQRLDRTEERLECWRSVIKISRDFPGAWRQIGCCLLDLRRFGEAIEAFDSELKLNHLDTECFSKREIARQGLAELEVNQDPDSYLEKGVVLKRAGRIDEAIKEYDRHLELRPESVPGWKNKEIALQAIGKYDAAIECCDRALTLDSDDDQKLDLLNDEALALRALGQPKEALECYDRALTFERKLVHVIHAAAVRTWQNKAALLDELGRYKEALACDDCSLQRDPDNPRVWENKARRLTMLGRLAEAEECRLHASTLEKQ